MGGRGAGGGGKGGGGGGGGAAAKKDQIKAFEQELRDLKFQRARLGFAPKGQKAVKYRELNQQITAKVKAMNQLKGKVGYDVQDYM